MSDYDSTMKIWFAEGELALADVYQVTCPDCGAQPFHPCDSGSPGPCHPRCVHALNEFGVQRPCSGCGASKMRCDVWQPERSCCFECEHPAGVR